MTRAEFLRDVKHEVNMIKHHATTSEINKLDFNWFNPTKISKCIYGLMTDDCRNCRAKELIRLCCRRVWHSPELSGTRFLKDRNLEEALEHVNGTDTQCLMSYDFTYLSALEGYIALSDAKAENIFDYLQGKVEKLEL